MSAPRKTIARKGASGHATKPQPVAEAESDRSGWPGVVRYALEDWPRTLRLCVIIVVLLLAVHFGLRLWL